MLSPEEARRTRALAARSNLARYGRVAFVAIIPFVSGGIVLRDSSVLLRTGFIVVMSLLVTLVIPTMQIRANVEKRRLSESRLLAAETNLEAAIRASPGMGDFIVRDDAIQIHIPGYARAGGGQVTATGHGNAVVGPEDEDADVPDAPAGDESPPMPPGNSLALAELWEVTHARLNLYHGIALKQSAQSFRSAQGAMIAGFLILAGFMWVAWKAGTTSGSIVAGALGAASAALAGYVGKTFIKSQETASVALRSYFDQPLELSRYLAAERLMVDAGLDPDKRAELLGLIVKAMLIPPGVAEGDGTPSRGAAGEYPAGRRSGHAGHD